MSSEWKRRSVAELHVANALFVVDGNHGADRPLPHEFVDIGVSFIRATDMAGGHVLFESAARINATARERIRKGGGKPGDVLLSHKGTVGKVALVPDQCPEFVCSPQTTLWRVQDDEVIDRHFLFAYMQSKDFKDQLAARKGETDMADYVSLTAQRQLSVLLPPIIIQRQIGAFVSALHSRITLLRETNATLEAIAQALFKSWFVDFDPVHAKQQGRAPEGMDEATAALFPDSFKESERGLVPQGWRVGAFADICSISSGKRPPDRSDTVSDECLIPLYGGAGLMGFTSASLFNESKILTGRVGTLGKIHIAYPPFWASDNVLVITPNDKSFFSLALHWLRSIDVTALNRGSTQPLLTQRDLGAQLGAIPTSGVVAVFEEVVAPLYQRIRDQELQAQTLATLRDTLLPRLISGQLRLPEASSVS